ncbi:MAG: glycosyltransferase family 2 protein, partial [Desulfobacteraceae bacterium]|nr:glycosyltransferase family 2 protein [Desulfobacteraceae bacterium]
NKFLHEVKLLIKPGGGLLLFEANPWNLFYQIRNTIRRLLPIAWERPSEALSLNRLEFFSVLSELGYIKINILPYDFLYSPVPEVLLWPAKNLSIIMENFPYLRNFAGSLFIWAYMPSSENEEQGAADLCDHEMFFEKVSFVIPCHNEEMNIPPLINALTSLFNRYISEIVIVDDNSVDRTAEISENFSKEDKRIRIVKRSPPNGVGRALRDGLREAKGEYILIMDSDFQHIIPEMRDMFDAVANGADVAVGSRFSRESVLINYAFTKILANRIFHILANLLFNKHFRDISNNLKLFRRDVAKNLLIESDDFAANAETGLKPILLGYKVTEVPISWINRSIDMGFSTFRILKTGPNYWKILLRLVWRRITRQPYQKK